MMVVAAKLEMEFVVLSAEHTLDEVAEVAAVGSNDLVNSSAVKDDDDPPHQRSRLLDPVCQK